MQAVARKGKSKRRVLVVDDNIDNVRSLTMLIVCRQIRLNPELRATRIYGITGSKNEKDRKQALEAGCDEVLLKPIPIEELGRLVARD